MVDGESPSMAYLCIVTTDLSWNTLICRHWTLELAKPIILVFIVPSLYSGFWIR
jgi:hypothetical protein